MFGLAVCSGGWRRVWLSRSGPMTLDRITLSTFRNHAASELSGTGRFNLLVGPNGAGKTNILEALSLLSPGRGLRRAALSEMAASDGPGGFAVGASLDPQDQGQSVRLGTWLEPDPPHRRKVRINAANASAAALGEWLAVGWLTPAMDGMLADAAQARRRFMDRMALALDPMHASHASRYETALRERNRILADDRAPDAAWLDAIERQMVQHGAALAAGRALLVDALMAEIVGRGEESFPRPALTYAAGGPVSADALSQAWHDGRARDRKAGRTLIGPHRDDLEVLYAAKRAPAAQCSTGEQKALLLAITLAHASLATRGRASLLLLDEVAAHLDPARRAALFERLGHSGTQIWMTGTETAPFETVLGEAAVWEVRGGAVSPL